jgi:hypothetical protein
LECLDKLLKKETILKSFKATGIWPMNADVILKRFSNTPPISDRGQSPSSRLSPTDWIHMERLIRLAVADKTSKETKQLSGSLHHLQVQNELLHHKCKGLEAALKIRKKRKKHGKALPLGQSGEYHGGAVLFSPRAVQRARDEQAVQQQEEEEEQLQKLQRKKKREEAKLPKQLQVKERREERERAKVVREKEKAEKAAEKQRQQEERDSKKDIQLSQKGKRKALRAPQSNNKRQKRSGGGAAIAAPVEEPSAQSPPRTARGRSVRLPSKFR